MLVAAAITALPGTAGAVGDEADGATVRVRASVQARAQLVRRPAIAPKLEYQLGMVARPGRSATREAERLGMELERGAAHVILQTRGRVDLRRLAALGVRTEGRAGPLLGARVPVAALGAVAGVAGVQFVRLSSYQELDAIQGEEVVASNAQASLQKGWSGRGVKVAVIDQGFGGYQERIAEGELPANVVTGDFCGDGQFTANTNHGTAVAEIVHEMAPNAQLHLVCFQNDVGFAQAEQFARARGVQIITHSGSTFNNGRGDGAAVPGTEGAVVATARNAGILWVNSAGNSAQRHWNGTFTDPNANGYMNFAPDNEGNGFILEHNEDVCVFLKWDEWPVAANDFDLVVLDQSGTPVAASQTRQTGTQPPTERICPFTNTGGRAAFFIAVGAARAAAAPRMDIFVRNIDPQLQYITPESSVGDPGASPFAFSAGAICWQNNALEPYSGQGPTIDGRVKPDIAGQDSNSGATYGRFSACGQSGFTGTSASAPAVAGAAALAKEQNPSFTVDQLQQYLQTNAGDLGAPGPDNQFGFGKLTMPTPTRAGPGVADTVPPVARALRSKGVRGKPVRLLSRASDDKGEVRIIETIKRGARTLGSIRTGFAQTRAGVTYYVVWRPPRTIFGALRHCTQAFDRSGNKSAVSCAALTISRR